MDKRVDNVITHFSDCIKKLNDNIRVLNDKVASIERLIEDNTDDLCSFVNSFEESLKEIKKGSNILTSINEFEFLDICDVN